MENLAIFASGTGSNAKKIIEYFEGHPNIRPRLIVSNNASAPVLALAEPHGLGQLVLKRASFYGSEVLLEELKAHKITFVVLAGFLWLVPPYLVGAYKSRMVNIHPALLPKFGGQGMYGMNVHRAVKAAGEQETGMTVHLVNEAYDEGAVLFQASCPIAETDTPEDIARKVLALEHQYFAPAIESYLQNKSS